MGCPEPRLGNWMFLFVWVFFSPDLHTGRGNVEVEIVGEKRALRLRSLLVLIFKKIFVVQEKNVFKCTSSRLQKPSTELNSLPLRNSTKQLFLKHAGRKTRHNRNG